MATNIKVSELLGDKPMYEQSVIIARVLIEVGGVDERTAFTRANLYTFKAQFGEIDEIEEFKQRFASLGDSRIPTYPLFFSVRKCIEEFYFAYCTPHETMKRGYWRCIFEVLNADKIWGRIFSEAFELTGCRQEEGKYKYREDSYWISTRIVEHYAKAGKIADIQAAREKLQQDAGRALRNILPDDHECVKAEFAKKLADCTSEAVLSSFYP